MSIPAFHRFPYKQEHPHNECIQTHTHPHTHTELYNKLGANKHTRATTKKASVLGRKMSSRVSGTGDGERGGFRKH